MRYILILFCVFSMSQVTANITLTIVDQENNPVSDVVVIASNIKMVTPNTEQVMDQIDSSFVPRVLVVQKGQSVSFPNSDDFRHHVYSFSEANAFEIQLYKGTDVPPVLFDKPGLVALGCNIHDDMIGYIYVADNVLALKTDRNGQVQLPAQSGDSVTLWSERLVSGVQAQKTVQLSGDVEQTLALDLLPPIGNQHSTHSGFGRNKWSN
ncbi:methylamine utilization protein [Marinomonas hwangdonensis]|uniref:Methylamine utilization protein n=1 Tax=Marinomonas hwangdonensis TaxID=1053647 RepID=A0A3M8Q7B9_9GAMM|nr:methylamine utilization protein [Marinomonas hwangdonensis]RNF51074.1 methylamine utilization protein [Marinomonas hwangdonensis]